MNRPADVTVSENNVSHWLGANQPRTMLDFARSWSQFGIHIFPCRRFLGIPEVDNWYKLATTDVAQIVAWWSSDPLADIAAVPDRSGYYVLAVVGDAGRKSLARLEAEHGSLEPEFRYHNRFGSEHLWFAGKSYSSHGAMPGLHLIGTGRFIYLTPSWAPDECWGGASFDELYDDEEAA